MLPGAKTGFAAAESPSSAHGQDARSGAFPYGGADASADGVVAPLWTTFEHVNDGSQDAGRVFTWTSGAAPSRRFVVSWENVGLGGVARATVQAHLFEGGGRIVFAYAIPAVEGAPPAPTFVCGLDEPGGVRFTAPMSGGLVKTGLPTSDFVFEPRTVLFNDPAAPKVGTPVAWQHVKRESLGADDSARPCCYIAKGTGWFWLRDRAASAGDPQRWVRQVMDAKAVLVLRDGGAPVRLWMRVVEFFTVDERGMAGADDHLWNLRLMLEMAFPADDPRRKIENYVAWRGMTSARLTVVKLFDAKQKDDAGPQYTSNRKNEYVLWCAAFKTGARGPMPDHDLPSTGWTRFAMKDHDEAATQHADARDLREVLDPDYVDGNYEYVIASDEDPANWVSRLKKPLPAMTEEPFECDPGAAGGTTPPR
jgi:hypothetical protein